MRAIFFRDHEISGLGQAGADPLTVGARAANRNGRCFNPFFYLIVPVLGIATFVPAWLTSAGIKVFSFVVPLAPPASYMGPGVGGFMLVGVAYLGYLYARHPRRVTEVGLVHLDEPAGAAETGPATGGEATPWATWN